MQPQDIVEEEELERLNALLRRENLIRSLGIVEQITSIVQASQQSQRNLHEYRVRALQSLSQSGEQGLSWHMGVAAPQEANVMVSGSAAWGSSACWALGVFWFFYVCSQALLFLALVSSQVQLPTFSQGTSSLYSHLAITPPSAAPV